MRPLLLLDLLLLDFVVLLSSLDVLLLELVLLKNRRVGPSAELFALLSLVVVEEYACVVRSIYRLFLVVKSRLFYVLGSCPLALCSVSVWRLPLLDVVAHVKARLNSEALSLCFHLSHTHLMIHQLLLPYQEFLLLSLVYRNGSLLSLLPILALLCESSLHYPIETIRGAAHRRQAIHIIWSWALIARSARLRCHSGTACSLVQLSFCSLIESVFTKNYKRLVLFLWSIYIFCLIILLLHHSLAPETTSMTN